MRTRLVARLQRHGDAGERAAGADGADEAVDLAVGLPPDFRPGRLDVALAVGDVVELVGPDRAVLFGLRQLLGEPAGEFHVIVGVGVGHGRHLDQLGAAQPQRVLLLLALASPGSRSRCESPWHCRPEQARCRYCRRCPRRSRRRAAARPFSPRPAMMNRAARSLTDWPGLMNSALPRMVQPVAAETRSSLINGVLPIASMIPLRSCIVAKSRAGDPK